VIVVDTNILAYALGGDHPLRDVCRQLVDSVGDGEVDATTTVEVVQELVDVRSRRTAKPEAVEQGREVQRLLTPLLQPSEEDLIRGLDLFTKHQLGCFDAVLAATALREDAALVSADRTFADVDGLRYLDPASPAFFADLGLA
jgi:uncharacterized protein